MNTPTRNDLVSLVPRHDSFVGIDSDGCLFDTMAVKQKECFHPLIIAHWRLESIAGLVRETAEFLNLYSVWRGQNRFKTLLRTFDMLALRPEVRAAGMALPSMESLRAFIDRCPALGNPALAAEVSRTGDPDLASILAWSEAVNRKVAETAKGIAPFPWARESLERIAAHSDVICVSQTPYEALAREWEEHGITHLVRVIAGQELGTKEEHLRLAAGGRYAKDRILMIGDAPGDLAAARANGCLFYPINPETESACWRRFLAEAYGRFLDGAYAGGYEDGLIAEFNALLPERPPWPVCVS